MNIRICDVANQIPLNPPVSKGEVSDPLFGKEGLGEVSGRCGGELRSQDAGFYGAIKPFSYGSDSSKDAVVYTRTNRGAEDAEKFLV